ncbi:flagellar basal body rod protein FlgC [Rhodothalassium salexigens]|uniref:Flagellar basal-body rod protein FlgC n=1 Tax=Rhodothalassium salexigens DSM 2132 TaxID=1188247 RepID=A0A4R2PBP5_RHOSA|nr:flagellar basal body rod protein FlgC [Rhodothalassium salexigens]MBB4212296.1 flagellar basal-body rod protein FlgC [Rhodothalassium salexigens DSM 2132]MBK1638346.1 flagellar basal body rod protein FlgC [Rhodothalassium salexigens DSM 2132]MBK5910492.1 flagellar basal body rod protein FlgC [Rhodothalassium salexigens]MBK5921690.1 flagellar basal body rod protein FlgC [Rhodothalassium salexigens]TCP32553.1 flagellar basal-body rod protein FlgC [Rhodothalassium salexigens DSM 2132]
MDIEKAMMVSAAGLRAQSVRMRIIAENMANADSTALRPGDDPYRRKVVTFKNTLDDQMGVNKVGVHKIDEDKSAFGSRYEPGHPAADASGYVATTNVKGLVEAIDMQQAQRSYKANLNTMDSTKRMAVATVELLR